MEGVTNEDDETYDRPLAGPDERDADLLDGSWEARYYASDRRKRDWRAIGIGISLLVLLGLLVPVIALFTQ